MMKAMRTSPSSIQRILLVALSVACWTFGLAAIGNDDQPPDTSTARPSPTDSRGLVRAKPEAGPFVETPHGFMAPYTETIPGTDASFEMIPVPGGKFLMGSPEDEEARSESEGPQVEIEVPPFWIGRTEVTWAEYKPFMAAYDQLKSIAELRAYVNYEFKDDARRAQQQKVLAALARLPAL